LCGREDDLRGNHGALRLDPQTIGYRPEHLLAAHDFGFLAPLESPAVKQLS
jgi:hypothetical protein